MTTRTLTFGRGPGADITIDDEYASNVHCRITHSPDRTWVEDLGSTNGTWIITKHGSEQRALGLVTLRPGDRVRIGRTTLPWETT